MLDIPPTPTGKRLVYDAFKAYLGYSTLSGASQMVMHRFIFEVVGTMAVEFGRYIPMPNEPENAEELPLAELWSETKRKKP